MTTVLFSKFDVEYLHKCATQLNFAYGIIIGQKVEPGKYVIIHLAKNSEEEIDYPGANQEEVPLAHGPQKVEEINLQTLLNQWSSANKMIPGSFNILGIFIAGSHRDLVDETSEEFKTAKRLFYNMHNLLNQSHLFKSTDNENTEYIYVAYSSASKKVICKMYNYVANGGSFGPADFRFVEKPFEWYFFESTYEVDDIFPILDEDADSDKINIEVQFNRTIEAVRKHLAASVIFIQNEDVENDQILENYVKQKQKEAAPGAAASQTNGSSFKATIYLPVKCQQKSSNPVQVKEFIGTIRLRGVISSRVWCNPKTTISDVKRFIREDILRSLMARIQVYCDGLTEPNISNNAIFISEPPRRVYYNVNTASAAASATALQFSEYIFRGETPTVAAAQAKQILDLDIASASIVGDVECLPEDDSFSDASIELQDPKKQLRKLADQSATRRDLTRTMYMLGISVSLLVLVISIVLNYTFN